MDFVVLNFSEGTVVNNEECYPMIRDARITDPTYVPYAMTNRELTEYTKRTIIDLIKKDVASSQTLTYTGLSVTVPANKCYNLSFELLYVNSAPNEILVSTRDNESQPYYTKAHSERATEVSICGYTETTITFYLWGKWDNATTNWGTIKGWYV